MRVAVQQSQWSTLELPVVRIGIRVESRRDSAHGGRHLRTFPAKGPAAAARVEDLQHAVSGPGAPCSYPGQIPKQPRTLPEPGMQRRNCVDQSLRVTDVANVGQRVWPTAGGNDVLEHDQES